MADMVVNYAITRLKDAATDEIKFQLGFNDEIDRLKSLLRFMHAAEKEYMDNSVLKEWVAQLRDTASAIEDLLDEFLLDMELAESDKPSNLCDIKSYLCFVACFFKQTFLKYQFHQQLNSINKKLDLLTEGKSKFQINSTHQAQVEDESDPGRASPYFEDPDVVGIEERVAKLENFVEQSKEQMMVITVCGPGGSGKTTLVKRLYKNIQKEKSIECYAWVFVTQTFKFEAALRQMAQGLYSSVGEKPPGDIDNMVVDRLRELLINFLQDRRYALILDDVWHPEVLEKIQTVLPANSRSAIIITTRDETVDSKSLLDGRCLFKVDPLDDTLAWELFCKVAFRGAERKGRCPRYLYNVVKQLVRRCQGLPLAIMTLAQLMSTKGHNPGEWNGVLQSLSSELKDVNQILLLSYNHLPTHLKFCFLYCAMLPKKRQIWIEKLIKLFVAEGFVMEIDGKTLEDVAKEYLFQLSYRSLLQIVTDRTTEPSHYQMHDLLRDVAFHVIGKENFGVICSDRNYKLESKSRRLVIYQTTPNIEFVMSNWKLRSLLVFDALRSFYPSLSQMLQSIKLLRVLDLDGTPMGSLPDQVGNLIYLRFLGLRWTSINNLPDSLRKLRHLQTLDVRDTYVNSLPDWIAELQQLRHFYVRRYLRFSNLTFQSAQLQTLSGMHLNGNQARELGQLTQLRTLNVQVGEEEDWEEVCASFGKLAKLQSLSLSLAASSISKVVLELGTLSAPRFLEKLVLYGELKELPYSLRYHSCLKHINLYRSYLKDDPFITLGSLPNLISLTLSQAYLGEEIFCGPGSFPKLKYLEISAAPNLRVWNHSEGAMKWLESLIIDGCKNLTKLPDVLVHLRVEVVKRKWLRFGLKR